LRTVGEIPSSGGGIFGSLFRNIDFSFAFGVVIADGSMEFQFRQKMEFVIDIGISDDPFYVTG
jgi:hypothetical protein